MRGDIPAAALNLLSSLPGRRHEWAGQVVQSSKERVAPRAVVVEGRRYDSLNAAKKSLRIGSKTLHKWLESGMATLA